MPISPDQPYEAEKMIWTDEDFERMGWHDVNIHAIAFRPDTYELLMDIDYMFAWVDPEKDEKYYTFWMAPSTLVFSNVHSFTAEIEWGLGLEISHVERHKVGIPKNAEFIGKDEEWKWIFECQEGTFSFISVGYNQFTRSKPVRAKSQSFDWDERGGISFDRVTFDEQRSKQEVPTDRYRSR